MKKLTVRQITFSALVGALYVALCYFGNIFGLSFGIFQCRFAEALTVLPIFTPAAVPGLFVGCLLANALTGCAVWDVIAGSLATLLGALGTRWLRKRPVVCLLPPILANTVTVPFVLAYVYRAEGTIPYFMLTVGAGEILSCGVLGWLLRAALQRYGQSIPWAVDRG